MERQRSFSIKPTRLLLFSLTIPSSLLFCFLFSSWALTFTTPASIETHLQFSEGFKSIKAQSFSASTTALFVGGTENRILEQTHVQKPATLHGKALGSGDDGKVPILAASQLEQGGSPSGKALGSVSSEENSTEISKESLGLAGERSTIVLDDTHLLETLSFPNTARTEEKSSESDGVVLQVRNEKFERNYMVNNRSSDSSSEDRIVSMLGMTGNESARTCDVSDGRWVFDESYPLYTSNSCPYIDEGFSCEANGRLDKDYMKWRWRPHDCNIPRFNPVRMLELIRGKRLVFVGDSINRNQWESMLCMLRGAVKDPTRVFEARGRRITKNRGNYNFKFIDYRCSVEYYVTHFLVHESKARVGQRRVKTLRIDTIDRSSSRWRGADILVFNTAHWWSHYKTKAGVNYYQEKDQVHPRLDVSIAFQKALMTWASWVDQHVTPGKTQVFFRSSSPSHFRGGEWNSGGHCKESTHPLNDTSTRHIPEKNTIVEEVVKQMKTPVTILNITSLSGLRIDGHPSIYGRKPGRSPSSDIQDCSHWCLPGVPDVWNEILYFYLLSKQIPFSAN